MAQATAQPPRGDASRLLSPSAYRELQPGESYEPYVPAGSSVPEFTSRSVTLGLIAVLVFSVAATYSGLKVAQVFEAAVPISILENVIIQSIGGASGLVVAGSIFTLPALFIRGVAPSSIVMLMAMFIVAILGSVLTG